MALFCGHDVNDSRLDGPRLSCCQMLAEFVHKSKTKVKINTLDFS
jgi:hypothetical protein